MITINSLDEMQKYYVEEVNTYVFDDDVRLTFDLNVDSHIKAGNIDALDIKAGDIKAGNIDAENIDAWNIDAGNIGAVDINARDINYFAVCCAYKNIECNSIKGRKENAKHFVLDGEIILKPKEQKKSITLELTDEQLEKVKKILK